MTQIDKALKTGRRLTRQATSAANAALSGGEMLQEWGGTVRKPEPSPVG